MLLRLIVSVQFQDLFHSPIRGSFHLSLAVLVHYRSQKILRLGGWSPRIQAGFHVSRSTLLVSFFLRLQDFHFLRSIFPNCSTFLKKLNGLVRFRSPLLSESLLISFPVATKMFQFTTYAPSFLEGTI